MSTKEELSEDWADTVQTLESLREVIVKQRTKWRVMTAKQINPLNTDEKKFFDYIVKLHKESEVLEYMINRIENGMTKSRNNAKRAASFCLTITSGEQSE
jgi:hypothetical protein